jgi:hypothetical protein
MSFPVRVRFMRFFFSFPFSNVIPNCSIGTSEWHCRKELIALCWRLRACILFCSSLAVIGHSVNEVASDVPVATLHLHILHTYQKNYSSPTKTRVAMLWPSILHAWIVRDHESATSHALQVLHEDHAGLVAESHQRTTTRKPYSESMFDDTSIVTHSRWWKKNGKQDSLRF